jgi:hypothetical protein
MAELVTLTEAVSELVHDGDVVALVDRPLAVDRR